MRIDDSLYQTVKERAAASGRTVSAVLEDAVRMGMRPGSSHRPDEYRLQPSGSGGLRPGVDLGSNAAMAEVLDEGVPLDALR